MEAHHSRYFGCPHGDRMEARNVAGKESETFGPMGFLGHDEDSPGFAQDLPQSFIHDLPVVAGRQALQLGYRCQHRVFHENQELPD